jgi:hypothetical protein
MHLRGHEFAASIARHEDYRLAAAAGIIFAVYVCLALGLGWLMQPTVVANSGLTGYRPPPKTVVHYADSPWVPPTPSEASPIFAQTEPASESSVAEEPKKETKKQEAQRIPRRARPAKEQQNPFWGFTSSQSFGPRRWF